MGRLKEQLKFIYEICCLFQFHYGTIKRDDSKVVVTIAEISIPLWDD